jgi:hypothetical protein
MVMPCGRKRVVARAGRVAHATMRTIERALAVHLGLAPA